MNNTPFGLKKDDLAIIIQILVSTAGIEKAISFGSRAKGNYKPGSDIDIALFTTNKNLASHIAFAI
jgi:predicted nucleotidyltransferase